MLDKSVMVTLDVSSTGWLIYDKFDWNIYKIKTNGDSLTQLTFDGASKDPTWTSDGKAFWFKSDNNGAKKMSASGQFIKNIPEILSSVRENNGFIYYYTIAAGKSNIIQADTNNNNQRVFFVTNATVNDGVGNFQFNNNGTVVWFWSPRWSVRKNLALNTVDTMYNNQLRFFHFRLSL